MKPEQQRIAIAEACGTKLVEALDGYWDIERNGKMHAVGCYKKDLVQGLPDYLNDLNAMHEAEKVLNNVQRERYRTELVYSHAGRDVFATAAHRAEAFLRTIGKWEDDK